jgi:hypothetical protein
MAPPSWQLSPLDPAPRRGLRFGAWRGGARATLGQVAEGLRGDPGLRAALNGAIASAPFADLRWETPGATAADLGRPLEFVVLDSPGLAPVPEPAAFAARFRGRDDDVLVFPNLGGDATLIVPAPRAADAVYRHLGSFVRGAPAPQRDRLWAAVGAALLGRLGAAPVWLSTAGGGVSWLHVRLDDRPKYYHHAPYRAPGG